MLKYMDMSGVVDISKLKNPPEKHELETAKFFAARGKDVSFLLPSSVPDNHRPDLLMDGVEWEMKAPEGNGKHTIARNMHTASAQSKYIIFDLRRIRLPEKQCISQLEREYEARKYIRRLLVIKKSGELLEYSRK